jgi:hypothetical protein
VSYIEFTQGGGMADSDKQLSAVYVSWQTMKSALEQLSQGVPPSRIDRSVFPGLAWGVQSQLFAGMKFLGLTGSEGEATPLLNELVSGDEQNRKKKLKEIIERSYAGLIALDLTKTTPAQLLEKIGELYNVSGDTRGKAVRFFLSAAEYVGIPLNNLLTGKKTNGATSTRRRRGPAKAKQQPGGHVPDSTPKRDLNTGTSKTVSLKSGGTLTISATLDLFALNSTDRNFVFGLIDELETYETGRTGTK